MAVRTDTKIILCWIAIVLSSTWLITSFVYTKTENSYLRMTLKVQDDRVKVLQETVQVLENGVNTQQAQFNELARQCGRK